MTFPDVPLTQERQQDKPEAPMPSLDVSEGLFESSSSDSNSSISGTTVAYESDVGNALVRSTHSATTNLHCLTPATTNLRRPTPATPLLKPPRQMIDRPICVEWLFQRCFNHACEFTHPLIPQSQPYDIVGNRASFPPLMS
jgi:hypothetical protein